MAIHPRDRRALVRELARTPSGVWVRCAGPSMEPAVRLGDRVRVVAASRPRIGDVVLLETADGRDLVLHRVTFALPRFPWFWHDGDAGAPDPAPAHVRQLVGRALLARRRPGLRALAAIARRCARALWPRAT